MKENIIQNRRIKYDMHNTKEIENKNDGIEEKIFTNSKKDRMEKLIQMNLVSERKKSFFFLDILATIVDGCEAIKMKKSLIVIGFLQ